MKKLENIVLTMQEIWLHTKPMIVKSKKEYTRKSKHKGKDDL